MTTELHDLLERVGEDALLELLSAYGISATVGRPHSPHAHQIIGVVGFTSPDFRGNLALVLSSQLAEATLEGTDVIDWVGELANQMLGRVKNKLVPYAIELDIATPVVVAGLSIRVQEAPDTETRRVDCSTTSGSVHALINARLREGFELGPPSGELSAVSEGEVLMF